MTTTRVLLTIEQHLDSELLKRALKMQPEVEVVGEAIEVIDCMHQIANTNVDVWLHSWDQGPELEAVLSHVYSVRPDLLVIRVSPNEAAGYFQRQINSIPELLECLSPRQLAGQGTRFP